MPKWKDHTLRPKPGVDLNIFPILHSTSYFVFFLFFCCCAGPNSHGVHQNKFSFPLTWRMFLCDKNKACCSSNSHSGSNINNKQKK